MGRVDNFDVRFVRVDDLFNLRQDGCFCVGIDRNGQGLTHEIDC